jgi:hypothetical protein
VFIDELTFIDSSPTWVLLLYNRLASVGIHVILSGTHSYALKLASQDLAYDRIKLLHTTIISFSEYQRLLGNDIKDYLKTGGIMETVGDSWSGYLDTAIVSNIARSLVRSTVSKYKAIANIKEDSVRSLLVYILQEIYLRPFLEDVSLEYEYPDLNQSLDNLLRRNKILPDAEIHETKNDITQRLHLTDVNADNTKTALLLLRDVLVSMEVLDAVNVKTIINGNAEPSQEFFITQPGLMYYQAAVSRESVLRNIMDNKELAFNIGNVIEGRILENSIFRDFTRKFPALQFNKIRAEKFELDIVISDENNNLWIYEVKRSPVLDHRFSHNLRHEKLDEYLKIVYGDYTLKQKAVLYTGDDGVDKHGIQFLEVSNFLNTWEPS